MKGSISKKQLREFGLLIGFGFPIIVGWILPTIAGSAFKSWTLWISIPFFILGILKPYLLLIAYKGWMRLGNFIGWINSHILLGLVFLLIVQPTSLIMKSFGYDPLKKKQNNQNSYRENNETHKIDLTRIF